MIFIITIMIIKKGLAGKPHGSPVLSVSAKINLCFF